MKRLFMLLSVTATLTSLIACATVPAPRASSESLVIGSFALSFPDGFFGFAQTVVDSQVRLNIRDLTTGRWFSVYTVGGHFNFRVNGADRYVVESSEYHAWKGTGQCVVGARPLGVAIPAEAGKVISLGNLVLTYTPHGTTPITRDDWSATDYQLEPPNPASDFYPVIATKVGWDYSTRLTRSADSAQLLAYLHAIDARSAWERRGIVEVGTTG